MRKIFTLFSVLLFALAANATDPTEVKSGTNTIKDAISNSVLVLVDNGNYVHNNNYLVIDHDVTIMAGENVSAVLKFQKPIQITNGAKVKFKDVTFDGSVIEASYDYLIRFNDATASSLEMEHCTINSVTGKYTIRNRYDHNAAGTLILTDCTFSNNTKGVFENEGNAFKKVSINNCTISGVSSEPTIYNYKSSTPVPNIDECIIKNCTFYSNTKSALYNSAGVIGKVVMENCEFRSLTGNCVITGTADSQIGTFTIKNCNFHDITTAGVIYFPPSSVSGKQTCSKFYVTNSTFAKTDVSSDYRSTIYVSNYGPTKQSDVKVLVDHCTFFYNKTINYDHAAIKSYKSTNVLLSNCIFVQPENYYDDIPDGSGEEGAYGRYATYLYGGNIKNCLTFNYLKGSSYQGHTSSATRTDCNYAAPLFVDSVNANYTLKTSPEASPALNAALDGSHMGDPRWWPIGSHVNIKPATAKSTYVTSCALDFSGVAGLKAYVVTSTTASEVYLTEVGAVPAGTPLVLVGTASTTYNVPIVDKASASEPAVNLLRAGDDLTEFDGTTYDYLLWSDEQFHQIASGTIALNKAYLHLEGAPSGAAGLRIVFDNNNATSINNFESPVEVVKFAENGHIFIQKNGVIYNALGQIVR